LLNLGDKTLTYKEVYPDGNYSTFGHYLEKFEWSGKHKTHIKDLRIYLDYERSEVWF
tara:strand:+ start:343 stop:513 length:171 start_codon:yes stop_codon:yes gene_type:complete